MILLACPPVLLTQNIKLLCMNYVNMNNNSLVGIVYVEYILRKLNTFLDSMGHVLIIFKLNIDFPQISLYIQR